MRQCDLLLRCSSARLVWVFLVFAFALEEGGQNLLRGNGKSSALLMAAEGHVFDDAVLYYDHLMAHLRWQNLGHVLAGGNMDVGDVAGKRELQEAFALGQSIS